MRKFAQLQAWRRTLIGARPVGSAGKKAWNHTYAKSNEQEDSSETRDELLEDERVRTVKETGIMLRQLRKEGRLSDMRKLVDQALVELPWHPAYWWWKLFLQKGNAVGALEQWRTMSRLGVQKSIMHYDLMAELLATTNARHNLFRLHQEMRRDKTVPSWKFYRSLFNSCATKSSTSYMVPEAREVWRELERTPELQHLTRDPSVRGPYEYMCSNSLSVQEPARQSQIGAIGPAASVAQPQEIHREVVEVSQPETKNENIAPSAFESSPTQDLSTTRVPVTTGTTAASPFERRIQFENMLQPLNQDPDVDRTRHQEALVDAHQILQTSQVTSLSDYNRLIRSASRSQPPGNLMELLEEVCARGLTPDAETYAWIIRSLFEHGRPDEALALVDRMEVSGVPADMKIVNHVLQGLFNSGRADEAQAFFIAIIDENAASKNTHDSIILASPDRARKAFAIVMNGLIEENKFDEAMKMLPIMIREGLTPDVRIYEPLIRAAFQRKRVTEAMQFYELAVPSVERLKESNIYWKNDVDELVACVVSGFLINGREEEAAQFLNRSAAEGLWHNTTTKPYNYFIKRYAQTDRADAAWNLFEKHKGNFDPLSNYKLYCTVLKALYLQQHDMVGGYAFFEKILADCDIADQYAHCEMLNAAMTYGERGIADKVWGHLQQHMRQKKQSFSKDTMKVAAKWGFRTNRA